MKIELDNLRLGHAALSDKIYAGILSKDGKTWLNKVDVTNDFITAAIARWGGFKEVLTASDGKKYEITIKEIK